MLRGHTNKDIIIIIVVDIVVVVAVGVVVVVIAVHVRTTTTSSEAGCWVSRVTAEDDGVMDGLQNSTPIVHLDSTSF